MKSPLGSHPGDTVTLVSRCQKVFLQRATSRQFPGDDKVSQEHPSSLAPCRVNRGEELQWALGWSNGRAGASVEQALGRPFAPDLPFSPLPWS